MQYFEYDIFDVVETKLDENGVPKQVHLRRFYERENADNFKEDCEKLNPKGLYRVVPGRDGDFA